MALLALLCARLQLGHWPNRLGAEPPEVAPLAAALMYPMAALMLIAQSAPIVLLSASWLMFPPHRRPLLRIALTASVIGLAIWGIGLLVFWIDPAAALTWAMD
jgi:hypothetical protein